MWDPGLGREVRQQRAVPAVLQGVADQPLRRGQPRRRHPALGAVGGATSWAPCAGCAHAGVEFMPTPGSYYDVLPERLGQIGVGSIDESIDLLRELEILVDGGKRAPVPAADLPQGSGRPATTIPRPGRSSSRSSSARGTRGSAPETSGRSSRPSSASSGPPRRSRTCEKEARCSIAWWPGWFPTSRTPRCATRTAGCATRSASRATGFDGPYTILYHLRPPAPERRP